MKPFCAMAVIPSLILVSLPGLYVTRVCLFRASLDQITPAAISVSPLPTARTAVAARDFPPFVSALRPTNLLYALPLPASVPTFPGPSCVAFQTCVRIFLLPWHIFLVLSNPGAHLAPPSSFFSLFPPLSSRGSHLPLSIAGSLFPPSNISSFPCERSFCPQD